MTLKTILDRLFGKAEEINGRERCPTYLYRWTILKWRGRGIYLHHFVGDDWSRDLHDHPKRFITIGLKGSYIEWTPSQSLPGIELQRLWKAPWIRSFPATHIHRITMVNDSNGNPHDCWTFVIVLKAVRNWGFWHFGKFIPWREYVNSETADQMKACD
jgi:hypothetical protein